MDASFCIITSNIRYSTQDDGDHAWDFRKHILAEILNQHDPFILATQEGRQTQILSLRDLLPNFTLIDGHRQWIAERMYPSFFVNQKMGQVLASGDFWLSETPHIAGSSSFGSMFPRLCTWMRLNFLSHTLLVANTHLDHVKDETRERQAEVLCREIKKLKRENDTLIILGDFNASPESRTRQIIMQEFPELRDDWDQPEESTHHPFCGTNPNGSRIDWILSNFPEKVKIALDKTHQSGIWPSDHFPVIGWFKT
jgi:endonuclease/exonuclease/phosphatase family metal-dependent hydrolase